jgi:hypothetical protein
MRRLPRSALVLGPHAITVAQRHDNFMRRCVSNRASC